MCNFLPFFGVCQDSWSLFRALRFRGGSPLQMTTTSLSGSFLRSWNDHCDPPPWLIMPETSNSFFSFLFHLFICPSLSIHTSRGKCPDSPNTPPPPYISLHFPLLLLEGLASIIHYPLQRWLPGGLIKHEGEGEDRQEEIAEVWGKLASVGITTRKMNQSCNFEVHKEPAQIGRREQDQLCCWFHKISEIFVRLASSESNKTVFSTGKSEPVDVNYLDNLILLKKAFAVFVTEARSYIAHLHLHSAPPQVFQQLWFSLLIWMNNACGNMENICLTQHQWVINTQDCKCSLKWAVSNEAWQLTATLWWRKRRQ